MKTNTIKASVLFLSLSASPMAFSLGVTSSADLMGFTGFLTMLLNVALALFPLLIVIGLVNLTYYIYKGKRLALQASFSENIAIASSINPADFNKRNSRASNLPPPPMREQLLTEPAPKRRPRMIYPDNYAFLDKYTDIKNSYLRVSNLYARIRNSDMSQMLKTRADELKASSERTIDTLRSLDKVAPATEKSVSEAQSKLSAVIESLSGVIESYQSVMNAEFDSIKIPDTYEQQDELEKLRAEGKVLLARIQADSNFDVSEDKFRLDKIVNERLDQVWLDYTSAKSKYYKAASPKTLLITDQRASQDPDAALINVFTEIKSIYNDIEFTINSKQRDSAMSDLAANKNYFENR